jgi:hypothetical protein
MQELDIEEYILTAPSACISTVSLGAISKQPLVEVVKTPLTGSRALSSPRIAPAVVSAAKATNTRPNACYNTVQIKVNIRVL